MVQRTNASADIWSHGSSVECDCVYYCKRDVSRCADLKNNQGNSSTKLSTDTILLEPSLQG